MVGTIVLLIMRFSIVFVAHRSHDIVPTAAARTLIQSAASFVWNTRTTAYIILIYAATMWAAYILVFHKVRRGRLAVICAWGLICLSVLGYWAYPFLVRIVTR